MPIKTQSSPCASIGWQAGSTIKASPISGELEFSWQAVTDEKTTRFVFEKGSLVELANGINRTPGGYS
jgi:hypothetical protein